MVKKFSHVMTPSRHAVAVKGESLQKQTPSMDQLKKARKARGRAEHCFQGVFCEKSPIKKGSGTMHEKGNSSQSMFIRGAGIASLTGGLLYLLSVLFHPHGYARAAVPLSIVLMLMGVLGLHALLWKREGRLGLMGFLFVIVGLLLSLVGMAGSALGILNPNPLAPIINTGEHLGLVFIGAGMLCWGIVTLRVKALGKLRND